MLEGTIEDLEAEDTAEATDGARKASAALTLTQTVDADAEALARQLDGLMAALSADSVKTAAEARGGAAVVVELTARAKALRTADAEDASRPGTAEETQALDQLDGTIVRLCRRARKAAVAAAKHRGDPAIARAFKLDKIYRSRGGSAENGEEDEGGEEAPEGEGEGAAPQGTEAPKAEAPKVTEATEAPKTTSAPNAPNASMVTNAPKVTAATTTTDRPKTTDASGGTSKAGGEE